MQFDHVNIRTTDLEATLAFYRDVIGLEAGARPDFSFPGAWLYLQGRAIVHVNVSDEPIAAAEGPVNHVAFRTEDLSGVLARLDAIGIDYRLQTLPNGRGRQCFLRDPNGVRIEIGGP